MKKGISLIVLVITIIVLAILAGAIIISLSNTNIIKQASEAKDAADLANAKYAVALEYAAAVSRGTDGKAYKEGSTLMVAGDYEKALKDAGFSESKYTVTLSTAGVPEVATK